ncbi:MAG: isoleucine--tRNA ligase [Nanoarchaeota archaeon]
MYNFKEIEKHVEECWHKNKSLIKRSLDYDPKKPLFSFLEGPPTANAPPGLHHVEVRVFKDLFCRFKYMQGFTVPRKGGWDCHGLPVEVQIEKSLKLNSKKDILKYGVSNFINKCRDSVFSYIKDWSKLTEKMAYWIDLDDSYITLTNEYIESVWWSLKELYNKGLLYESHKVVPYCPRCQTPLSSHEVALGYKDVTEPAIIVKFKVKDKPNRYALAFTTTAWTLPSNLALAVKSDATYAVVKDGKFEYMLAKDLVNKYFDNPQIIEEFKGEELKGTEYEPIFDYFVNKLDKKAFFIIAASFVTLDEGTGIVHCAAAFGEEDYEACKANNLPFVQPVNEEGKFTDEVKDFKGMFVKDADPKIIKYLENQNKIFKIEHYTHSYPFCWRCNTPLLYYAMISWFIKVTEIKDRLTELNNKIKWYPSHIKEGRFGDWLNNLKDWALSRKKFWGTPLPIWRCSCGNEIVIGSIKELKKLAEKAPKNLDLHKPQIDEIKIKCNKCKKPMSRLPDVIDCWYDSGSSAFAQFHYPFENKDLFKKRFPYDFIAEAIDQTRGWFYTLHALGGLLFNDLAYKSVVCAGHIVDEKGEKMSKSKGNILNPWEMFDTIGIDAVRLQMCTTEPGDNKRFGVRLVNESVLPMLNILYNTYIYAKQYLKGKKITSKEPKLRIEDGWIISRIDSTVKLVTEELEKHNYHQCFFAFKRFIEEDFSRWYIKLIRDRTDSDDKALSYTFDYIFNRLTRILAPFVPYISDFIYQDLIKKEKSVHFDSWPEAKNISRDLESQMSTVKDIVTAILSKREEAKIGIRWPLDHVEIETRNSSIIKPIEKFENLIKSQTNVKKIIILQTEYAGPYKLSLDTHITPELEKEGYYRELIRRIQDLRKKAGLKKENKISLYIKSDYDLSSFTNELKDKVGAKIIRFGPSNKEKFKYSEKHKIKDREFEISFNLA